MQGLYLAILVKAMEDWDDPNYQSEIEEFLNSELFEELAIAINWDPIVVRKHLRTGNYNRKSIRAAYH